ncbi:hypothetical protein [Streptomyces griseofuscus]|uniref:hypothetical protein n=1 Tax=Streptomyces griseofuscus TaxID=146922 RepID=UPI003452E34A
MTATEPVKPGPQSEELVKVAEQPLPLGGGVVGGGVVGGGVVPPPPLVTVMLELPLLW